MRDVRAERPTRRRAGGRAINPRGKGPAITQLPLRQPSNPDRPTEPLDAASAEELAAFVARRKEAGGAATGFIGNAKKRISTCH